MDRLITSRFNTKRNSRLFDVLVYLYLLISIYYVTASNDANENKNIIIIGAGPAGIAAASKLFENGFTNVTILEAENRVGGRLHTIELGDYYVDLGGQWVHGQQGNVAFDMANPLGLLDTSNVTESDQELYESSGNLMSSSIDDNIENFITKYFVDETTCINTTSAKSFGEFIEKVYDEEFKNVPEMINRKQQILHYLENLELAGDSADSWKDVAASNSDRYIPQEGNQEVPWKTRGYVTILDILMKRYPDPKNELPVVNHTILNTEVTLIDYTGSEGKSPVVVSTKDGRKFEADHAIVTVSLGVLKEQHKSLFKPPLPSKKVEAIETLGFGSCGKVYFLFKESFWQDKKNISFFGFVWNDADRKVMENDPEKMWVLGVTGAINVKNKPKLVEFYMSSKYARAMEVIPENKVYNQTFELLERFLGKKYKIPKPIAMTRTQWYKNPHFRGTYSYHNVESEKRHIYPGMLQESITLQKPRVLFAGEATSPHRFSTADGAIESGWTAANNLINLYKKVSP